MSITMLVHIIAGTLGLGSGFLALYTTKGAPLHRRAGMVFFYVMLTMTTTGTVIAAVRNAAPAMNIPAGLMTAYLVVTGWTAVRPPAAGARWLNTGAMVFALAVALVCLTFGIEAIANGGTRKGMPAFPFFLFGGVGLLGSALDLKMIRAGGVRGAARIARHLWRMCFALFVATMSFFFGQADVLPKAIRSPGLLALPVLAVLVTMLYWVWKVGIRKRIRGRSPGAVASLS